MEIGRRDDKTISDARYAQADRETSYKIHKDRYSRRLISTKYTN
jgi:hypothetical protein